MKQMAINIFATFGFCYLVARDFSYLLVALVASCCIAFTYEKLKKKGSK